MSIKSQNIPSLKQTLSLDERELDLVIEALLLTPADNSDALCDLIRKLHEVKAVGIFYRFDFHFRPSN